MSPADIVEIVNDAGVIGLLILAILAGARGWWVFGRTYRESLEREAEWRHIALTAMDLTEQAREAPGA